MFQILPCDQFLWEHHNALTKRGFLEDPEESLWKVYIFVSLLMHAIFLDKSENGKRFKLYVLKKSSLIQGRSYPVFWRPDIADKLTLIYPECKCHIHHEWSWV